MDDHKEGSHTSRVMEEVRRRVLSGEIPGGERLTEVALAEELDVSRTPVRDALARLAEEGLLERRRNAGFVVRLFTYADVVDAIELRGVIEGTAARYAAERGLSEADIEAGTDLLAQLDGCFASAHDVVDLDEYSRLNSVFHQWITRLSGSALIQRETERVVKLPFAAPTAFLPTLEDMPGYARRLFYAQQQHHAIVEAIIARQGARAEALMREHAREARRNLEHLRGPEGGNFPGLSLIAS
ncbi:GntR family transcriptional regulator [Primorskyibacter sp. 2E233]|uniref:GntR family transcriptional regulator n=1 Tax=Primorskyibacter sp. 2E233 TaxID=3413431 RepID=UPI003BF2EDE5